LTKIPILLSIIKACHLVSILFSAFDMSFMIQYLFKATRCGWYQTDPELNVIQNNVLESIVPNWALVTLFCGLNIVFGDHCLSFNSHIIQS
jgi:hypothetical protein